MANKVQFNLKNVHYAKLTMSGGDPTWATPVSVPGAITLSLDPKGQQTQLHADGITYYNAVANNGYSGSLEMARIPEQMLSDIWGMTVNSAGVMVEDATTEPAEFALLYQIDGDAEEEFYTLYRCSGSRPGIGSKTNTDSKEPQTQSIDIEAMPLIASTAALKYKVKANTTPTTSTGIRSSWFNSVLTTF